MWQSDVGASQVDAWLGKENISGGVVLTLGNYVM